MEPNNNMQNDNVSEPRPVRAPGFANSESASGGGAPIGATPVNGGNDVVFQDKTKKSHGMLYGMILLAILAAGGIGFGVWAMMDGNSRVAKKDEQIASLNSQLAEKSQEQTEVESDTTIIDEEKEGDKEIIVDSNSKWDSFSKGLKGHSLAVNGNYRYRDDLGLGTRGVIATKTAEGHLTIKEQGNEVAILEMDNVLAMYFFSVGNGGIPYYYIVGFDGSVSRIDISESSSRQLEKVGDYNKIATILTSSDLSVILVDIDGNTYESY